MKVSCPRHDDAEPSCAVYEDHAYCYSGCGTIPLAELGVAGSTPRPKENIAPTIEYIKTLQLTLQKGFMLPTDSRGYYLVWPDESYYLLRKFEGEPKYIGPSGHQRPLFIPKIGSNTLMLVEGERNALSLASVFDYTIISPGSAGEFKNLSKKLTNLSAYNRVIIIVDKDPAGVLAAISAKSYLIGKVPDVRVIMTDPEQDCNDILVNEGKDALREEISKRMCEGMPG